ncbi:hypothetical protein [Ascidiimonas sp. W6]|uniref:hypothetical protein n=1 Tax=Ascidiimonas meishanensis TaxID=3128903 RepID=UPI0030EE5B14
MNPSITKETDIASKNEGQALLRAQWIGLNEFGLNIKQVASSSFNEETLANIIRLRVQGRAQSNQEALKMMEGLKPYQIKEMVNNGFSRQQLLNPSNNDFNIPKPEKSFIPSRILKGDWRIPDYKEPSGMVAGRSLDSLTQPMPVAKSEGTIRTKSQSEGSLIRTRSRADLKNHSNSPDAKRKKPLGL